MRVWDKYKGYGTDQGHSTDRDEGYGTDMRVWDK